MFGGQTSYDGLYKRCMAWAIDQSKLELVKGEGRQMFRQVNLQKNKVTSKRADKKNKKRNKLLSSSHFKFRQRPSQVSECAQH
jgi:hypothetical protein